MNLNLQNTACQPKIEIINSGGSGIPCDIILLYLSLLLTCVCVCVCVCEGFPVAHHAMQELQETQMRSLGQEVPLEEETPAHSSILAWRILWIEELG